jgi:hypothetical protein
LRHAFYLLDIESQSFKRNFLLISSLIAVSANLISFVFLTLYCSREVGEAGEAGITVSVGTDQYTPDHVSLALASIKGASVVRRTVRQFDTPLV